jgi:hypothetical protein
MSTMDSHLVRRSIALPDLVTTLKSQHDAKLDVVVPAAGIHSTGGVWEVDGTGHATLTPDGVTSTAGRFTPTGTCDAAMADKLGIPTGYLRRLRAEHLDLYDANVNGWLQRQPDRQLLVRTLRGRDAGSDGIARAVLSGRYRFVDNLDVLLAVLDGIRAAGADVQVAQCDLTERRMYVQIASQSVAARAETLLSGYVSPFTGARGADNPLVFAGFVLANSETRHGSFSITPRLVAQVCGNGYTITRDAMREVHLGGQLGEGVIHWSESTQRAAVDLIAKQATDATATFLTTDYLSRSLQSLEARAGTPIEDARGTIRYVSSQLRFTEDQQNSILDHYLGAGQRTAGGILQAITSAARSKTTPTPPMRWNVSLSGP